MKKLFCLVIVLIVLSVAGCSGNATYPEKKLSDCAGTTWKSTNPEMTITIDKAGKVSGKMLFHGRVVPIEVSQKGKTTFISPLDKRIKDFNIQWHQTEDYLVAHAYEISEGKICFDNITVDHAYGEKYDQIVLTKDSSTENQDEPNIPKEIAFLMNQKQPGVIRKEMTSQTHQIVNGTLLFVTSVNRTLYSFNYETKEIREIAKNVDDFVGKEEQIYVSHDGKIYTYSLKGGDEKPLDISATYLCEYGDDICALTESNGQEEVNLISPQNNTVKKIGGVRLEQYNSPFTWVCAFGDAAYFVNAGDSTVQSISFSSGTQKKVKLSCLSLSSYSEFNDCDIYFANGKMFFAVNGMWSKDISANNLGDETAFVWEIDIKTKKQKKISERSYGNLFVMNGELYGKGVNDKVEKVK